MASEAEAVKPLLVIPMTGISSRFTAAGYDRPKFLLEAEGQTVIDHVIDMYPGWDDVVFVCNALHLDDPALALERRLRSRRPRAVIVRMEHAGLGPGDAVLAAREHIDLDRPVVVNYCDFTCYWDADHLAERLTSGEVDGVIPCYTGYHPHMVHSTSYAYVKLGDAGLVADIQEKQPWTDTPENEYASSGTYAFASGRILLDSLDRQVEQGLLLKGEYYLSLTYKPLLEAGGRVEVMALQHFMQWGTPQDFEEYLELSRAIASWTEREAGPISARSASRVILASGAGARFARAGYDLPKPALPLGDKTVLEHAAVAIPGHETVVVTREDLPSGQIVRDVAKRLDAAVVTLPGLSEGQAASARAGLTGLKHDGPVTIGACDALPSITGAAFDAALELAGSDGVVVWLALPYHAAERSPEQYGWAAVDDSGLIDDVWLKQRPDRPSGVVIGTFSFGSKDTAIRLIDELMADGERVNGEFYLDSLIPRALREGRRVVALVTTAFASVGTPAEYEAVRYWQSCFHKWANHSYSLAADVMVEPTSRRDLDHSFRVFDPWPVEVSR